MTYPLVQFVSAPEVGATVRFDFNASLGVDVESFPEHEGFSLGAPEMVGNPGEYGTSWGDRELTLTAFIEGSRSAAFTAQTTLARELWRAENWLLFQLDATSEPRWFKTFRSAPGALSFEHIYTDRDTDLWGIPVTLTAEEGMYGPRETHATVTVTNDPAAGTNPMRVTLPTIKGDLPTPLTVKVKPSTGWYGFKPMLVASALSEAVTFPAAWQTSGFTAGTDTTASTADTAMSGGSRSTITFATDASLVTRLSGIAPSAVEPGMWRVMARMGRSDTATTFEARFGFNYGVPVNTSWRDTVRMTRTTSPAVGHMTWVDLGVHALPVGAGGLPRDLIGTPPGAPSVNLQVARLSGTGSVYVDAFLLLPVQLGVSIENQTLMPRWEMFGPDVNTPAVIDGDRREVRLYALDLTVSDNPPPLLEGGFPRATPGATNVLHLIQQTMLTDPSYPTTGNSDSITATADVTVSYHPRYLWIGE